MDFILSAPNRDVINYAVDILVDICFVMPTQYKQAWFSKAFSRIPGFVLTEEEKITQLDYLVQSHIKRVGLTENFDIIAKRARNAVNRNN
jgi:hypothetical protein